MENWAFAAPPRHPYVVAWARELLSWNAYPKPCVLSWLAAKRPRHPSLWFDIDETVYLAMHCASVVVLDNNRAQVEGWDLVTFDARQTALKWVLTGGGGLAAKGAQWLLSPDADVWPIIKVRGIDRVGAPVGVLQQMMDLTATVKAPWAESE
jgi:hypothetical protein